MLHRVLLSLALLLTLACTGDSSSSTSSTTTTNGNEESEESDETIGDGDDECTLGRSDGCCFGDGNCCAGNGIGDDCAPCVEQLGMGECMAELLACGPGDGG